MLQYEEQRGDYTIRHDDFERVEVYLDGTLLRESWGGVAANLINGTISVDEYLDWYEEQDRK
jgi:hypothetical protein